MLDLGNTTAFVAGGAGHVGEGIVRAFLARGARVAVASRAPQRLEELKTRLGKPPLDRLITLVGDVTRPEEAERLRDEVERTLGPLTAVVASVGGWWQGAPLTQVPVETWRQILDNNLTSHFVLAKTFLPSLAQREGSSYTAINGTAGEIPVASAGLASIASAANLMMSRVLMEEYRGTPVRINVVVMGSIHTRIARSAAPEWLAPEEVGTFCAYLASNEGRMVSGGLHHLVDRPALPPAS